MGLPTSLAPESLIVGSWKKVFVVSLKSKLNKRKPSYKDLVFCLDRPLVDELDAVITAERKVAKGRDGAYGSGGKSPRVRELEKKINDASITLRFTSVSRDEYYEVMSENPPREGRQEEFNPETFFEQLAKKTVREVTATGTMPIHDEDWDEFIRGCTDGEYDQIANVVVMLNRSFLTANTVPLG